MKGQAWNVVETLKIPDHGPLELTRRTRVCVVDEIVEIPVAMPMRTPSAEMRREQEATFGLTEEDEEMDISTMNGSTSKRKEDLLRFSPPPSELPNPNRFELSRNASTTDISNIDSGPLSPATIHGEPFAHGTEAKDFVQATAARPSNARSKTRSSYEDHRSRNSTNHHRPRAYHRHNGSVLYDGDGEEGDLGYAAARVTEKNTRKVIMEKVETVKSRNPVFSWC
jgi:phosphatidylinositol 4-kinase type 2